MDSKGARLRDVERKETIVIPKDTKMRKCGKEGQVGKNVECMAGGNN